MASDGNFSILEAVHPGGQPFQTRKPLPGDLEKQVVTENGLQVATVDGIEVTPIVEYVKENLAPQQHTKLSQRKWLIIGGVVGLIVILAAVLGGTLAHKRKSNSKTPSSLGPTSNPVNPCSTPVSVQYQRVLPGDVGELMEAADSANGTWVNSKLGYIGMNGSALAAAVSRPGTAMEINLFYTDTNHIVHDIIYDSNTNKWTQGVISGNNYTTDANTSLAAMYHQCLLCVNTTVMVFQDINDYVQFANLTTAGWTLIQLAVDPVNKTGLALQPFFRSGIEDQINLHYQNLNLNLSLASYVPAAVEEGVPGWHPSEQVYLTAAAGTPLAAASSYSNNTSGWELWIELLSLSDRGVEVDTWSGAINGWLDHENNPSAMANSTANVQSFGAIAMTAAGRALAVVTSNRTQIQSWQVGDDLVDWTSAGTVDIGSAWN